MKKVSMFSAVAAVAVAGASFIPTASVFAWGDNTNGRAGYTINQIEQGVLGNKVVFNSITDGQYTDAAGKVHKLGDERNFVRTRLSGTSDVWSSDEITVKDGKEYVISLYVHNNSPKGTEVVAKDTKVNFSIPGNSSNSVEVNGFITSSNANPSKYWDNVIFKTTDGSKFHLEYIEGSALWESNGKSAGKLSDAIKDGGVLVGYNNLDGNLPGCYQYSGYASVRVKVVYDNAFSISKLVRIKGTTEWKESVNAKAGDTVEYLITYKNISGKDAKDVMLSDSLPDGIKCVAGSTKLQNLVHPNGVAVSDGIISKEGILIGDYSNNATANIMFEAKVDKKDYNCSKEYRLVNWAKITASDTTRLDDATVVIAKTCKGEKTKELPNTGAESIVAGALGAGSIVTALGYFIASRKKLM